MSVDKRLFVDLEGLKLFKSKLNLELKAIQDYAKDLGIYVITEDGGVEKKVLQSGVVKDYVDGLLDGAVVQKQVFYLLDDGLNRIPVYEEAEGTASGGEVYYERSGNGSVSNPYVYTAADPQPESGTVLPEGLYYRTGEYEMTLIDTGDPVIDPETGEYVFVEATILDGQGEITEAEIRELFEEGH